MDMERMCGPMGGFEDDNNNGQRQQYEVERTSQFKISANTGVSSPRRARRTSGSGADGGGGGGFDARGGTSAANNSNDGNEKKSSSWSYRFPMKSRKEKQAADNRKNALATKASTGDSKFSSSSPVPSSVSPSSVSPSSSSTTSGL